ncbi:MAG: HEPN domain-containing protein [Elusimicrobia bacterium]|nr:HEPN domain-containing protein [Elusimicrobiota bacterium]
MNERIDLNAVVRAWIDKAEADHRAVQLLMSSGEDCPLDIVCFHAQQCVEKYLKAVLCANGVDFPKIHDIGELVALLPKGVSSALTEKDQERLTEYAVDSRYPGLAREISVAEATETAKIMDAARDAVKAALPQEMR